MNISVPDPMRQWVEGRVQSGRYASASDYLRDLIRRDQEQAEARAALSTALAEGEASGESPRRITDIIAALHRGGDAPGG